MAWVSLDAGDNDPARFWTDVLTALSTAQPGSADDALALLARASAFSAPRARSFC
jgi:LuxR family transcriptional regulator, maltose regulon positive regulatory protein